MPPSPPAGPGPSTSGRPADGLSPADVHVLLVDDERLARMVVGSLLRKLGYRVTEAESGLQAIAKLRDGPPGTYNLVLTDVMMPDVDGVELLRHVRAEPTLRDVPVVMMSANEHADTVFECIREGAEDYLLKPVGRKEVAHIWQHVWRRQAASAAAAAGGAAVPGGGGGRGGGAGGGGDEGGPDDVPSSRPLPPGVGTGAVPQGPTPDEAPAPAAAPAPPPPPPRPAAPSPRGEEGVGPPPSDAPPRSIEAPPAPSPSAARPPPAGALTLADYLARRGSRVSPAGSFRLFCGALALLRSAHAVPGAGAVRPRPSTLVLGPGGALAACAPRPAPDGSPGAVPPAEEAAYAAPEQLLAPGPGGPADAPAADVYALGVLFLELYHPLPDPDERAAVLGALRHRILPPALLAARPREAAFVTALVHPDPASRPSVTEILTSGWLPALRDASRGDARSAAAAEAAAAAAAAEPPAPRPPAAAATPPGAASPVGPPAAVPSPAPPPAAGSGPPDAALLIEFLGMVRAARAAEADAAAADLAALDADAAEVAARLAALAGGGGGGGMASAGGAAAVDVAAEPSEEEDDEEGDHRAPGQRRRSARRAAPPAKRARGGAPPAAAAPAADGSVPQHAALVSALPPPDEEGDDGVDDAAWARLASAAPLLERTFLDRRRCGGAGSGAPRLAGPPGAGGCDRPSSDVLSSFASDLGRFAAAGALVEEAALAFDGLAGPGGAGLGAPGGVGASGLATLGGGAAALAAAAAAGAPGADMVCSVAFDRDDTHFATAGVARRVRIFDLATVLGGGPAATCPAAEVLASSKLSCVAWNPYVKPLLLVAGYDGRVSVWDADAGACAAGFDGTDRRVWSVDWSPAHPGVFAAGGDDGVVRLWDSARPPPPAPGGAGGVISASPPLAAVAVRANVTSVSFCAAAPHLLAVGAADCRAYVYDTRMLKAPVDGSPAAAGAIGTTGAWAGGGGGGGGSGGGGGGGSTALPPGAAAPPLAVLAGHRRAVSYVRWAGGSGGGGGSTSSTPLHLVTASTDSRLKRWDVGPAVRGGEAGGGTATTGTTTPAPGPLQPVATYRGHANDRNFVGLAVTPDGGYVATGSEDDAVYVYCGGLPAPVARHAFSSGGGGCDAAAAPPRPRVGGRFVSALAWARSPGNSGGIARMVAANSAGIVKVLSLRSK